MDKPDGTFSNARISEFELNRLLGKIDLSDRQDSIEVVWDLLRSIDMTSSSSEMLQAIEEVKCHLSEFIC